MNQTLLTLIIAGSLSSVTLSAQYAEYLKEIGKHERNRNRADAITECRKAMKDGTLSQKERYEISLRLANNAMIARNYPTALDALEQAAGFAQKDRRKEADLAFSLFQRTSREHLYPLSGKAGIFLLKQGIPLPEKKRPEFFRLLMWTCCKNKNAKELESLTKNPDIPEGIMLELALLEQSRKSKAADIAHMLSVSAEYAELPAEKRLALLNHLAGCLILLNEVPSAEAVLAEAEKLQIPFRRNQYAMKWTDTAPPGAGGWILSNAWKQGGASEFMPYDQAAQAMLEADATAERVGAKNKNLDFYLKSTRFHFLCDAQGIHLFIVSAEKELEKYLAQNSGAGSLEIFLSPGMEREAYWQIIIDLPENKVAFYEKNSPHRSYRPAADFLKTETICRDDKMGTYVLIPWTFLYDRLPFDTKSDWRFNVIRWTPAGGVTWGGRVHELGRMGKLIWGEIPEKHLYNQKRFSQGFGG